MQRRLYGSFGKRLLDLLLAALLLLLLSPLLLLLALLVRLSSPGPALFSQPRLGRGGAVFHIYKFRTMTYRPHPTGRQVLGRAAGVTPLGYWLRRFKLDELPQLFNVLAGQMSLVGPRPALPADLAAYGPLDLRRLAVRPGLTGLAQVRGNVYLSWPQRRRLDAAYVARLSPRLDLAIMLRTVAVVLLGEGRFARPPATGGSPRR